MKSVKTEQLSKELVKRWDDFGDFIITEKEVTEIMKRKVNQGFLPKLRSKLEIRGLTLWIEKKVMRILDKEDYKEKKGEGVMADCTCGDCTFFEKKGKKGRPLEGCVMYDEEDNSEVLDKDEPSWECSKFKINPGKKQKMEKFKKEMRVKIVNSKKKGKLKKWLKNSKRWKVELKDGTIKKVKESNLIIIEKKKELKKLSAEILAKNLISLFETKFDGKSKRRFLISSDLFIELSGHKQPTEEYMEEMESELMDQGYLIVELENDYSIDSISSLLKSREVSIKEINKIKG